MAYDFVPGSSQIFETPTAPIQNRPMTFACWFNSDSQTADQGLISIGDFGLLNYYALDISGNSSDKVRAITAYTTAAVAESTGTYTAGTWHHACAVFRSNINRQAYIDGVGGTINATSKATDATMDEIGLGCIIKPSIDSLLDGRLAECGIWNVGLTDAEVAVLAQGFSPLCVRPQSLKFYAPLVRELHDLMGGLALQVNYGSPTVAVHPRIIYPHRPRFQTGTRVTAFPRSFGMVIG